MTIDGLQELSTAFGNALKTSLAEPDKDAEIRGGGLRHGDVEWQVFYFHNGLRRFLMFNVNEGTGVLVTISAQAGATDEEGRWASAVAASTSLPSPILIDELDIIVPQLLGQTRYVANSLGRNDLRAFVPGTLDPH